MPTCGMSCQGLLAGTQRQKYKNSEWEGGESEKGRQKERLIQGERDGTLMAPQVQCCISNPVVEEQRGSASINHCISLQLQSLLSVWAASTPPIVHTCKDRERSPGAATGGSSRSPFRLLQPPQPPTLFFSPASAWPYLHTTKGGRAEEGGAKGAWQRGRTPARRKILHMWSILF